MHSAQALAQGIWTLGKSRLLRKNRLGEFNIYETTAETMVRCWVFTDADGDIVISVFATPIRGAEPLIVRFRTSKDPLAGLSHEEIVQYVDELINDMSYPERLKEMIWSEATRVSRRFGARVPFHELARAYVLASAADGRSVTMRWLESTIDRLWKAGEAWTEPDTVAIEEGWAQNSGGFLAGVYHAALQVVLRERDALQRADE